MRCLAHPDTLLPVLLPAWLVDTQLWFLWLLALAATAAMWPSSAIKRFMPILTTSEKGFERLAVSAVHEIGTPAVVLFSFYPENHIGRSCTI